MQKQKTAPYYVLNQQTQKKEHYGSLEECTTFIRNYGLGWVFLEVHDTVLPAKKIVQTVRMVHPQI